MSCRDGLADGVVRATGGATTLDEWTERPRKKYEAALGKPAKVRALDSAGIGAGALGYLQQFPVGNDASAGADGGLNLTGFRFNAPLAADLNIYTTRIDLVLTGDGRHSLTWRGSIGDIHTEQ
jgi:hypothetical protein